MSAKVFTDKDSGFKGLMTKFQANKGEDAVFVGYLRSAPMHTPEKDENGNSTGQPIGMAQLGAIHEFGSSDGRHPPERSHIRSSFDGHKREIKQLCDKLMLMVIDGKKSKIQALGVIGQKMTSFIRQTIRKGIPPALADSTLAKKGASKTKPLIDSGQLINSIDWEVHRGHSFSGSSSSVKGKK